MGLNLVFASLALYLVLFGSASADCQGGYHLSQNNTCEDINECENQWGLCSQVCVNKPGTYTCACAEGYVFKQASNTRCKAYDSQNIKLLASTDTAVTVIEVGSTKIDTKSSVLTKTAVAVGLDYIWATQTVFWTHNAEVIEMAHLGGNGSEVIKLYVPTGNTTIEGLAVDWIHGNLYWTDSDKDVIAVMSLRSRFVTEVISSDLVNPRALAVDPLSGWMYWTDWGQSPARIERAGMDGSSRNTIVDTRLTWPNGITLDLILQRIFWLDAHEDVLESAKCDGTDRRLIMSGSSSLLHPFSVTTFEDYVYYSDWTLKAVYRANKFTGAETTKVYEANGDINTIQVYHPLRQPEGQNRCAGLEGCCSYLCVPVPTISNTISKVSCSCPGRNLSEPEDLTTTTEMATEADNHEEEHRPYVTSTLEESITTTAGDSIEHAEQHQSTTVEAITAEFTAAHTDPNNSDHGQPVTPHVCKNSAKVCEDCYGSILAAALLTLSINSVLTIMVAVAYTRFGSRGMRRRNFENPIYSAANEEFILSSYGTNDK